MMYYSTMKSARQYGRMLRKNMHEEKSQENILYRYLKQKYLFSEMESRKVKQLLSGGWCQWKERRYKG
jgi:hypothetical protein